MSLELTPDEYRALLKRPKTARYAPTEAQEQIALFEWIDRIGIPREPRLELAFHVPNGELREKAVGARLKAMGTRAGVPDVILPIAARGFIGLAIELKVGENDTSPLQDAWLERLREADWFAQVNYGWVNAARRICWYLGRTEAEMGLEGVER